MRAGAIAFSALGVAAVAGGIQLQVDDKATTVENVAAAVGAVATTAALGVALYRVGGGENPGLAMMGGLFVGLLGGGAAGYGAGSVIDALSGVDS